MSFNPPYTSQTSLLSYLGSSWNNVTVSPSATSATGMVTTSNGPPLTIPGEEKEAFVEDAPTNQDSKAILGSFSSPQVIPESLSRPEIIGTFHKHPSIATASNFNLRPHSESHPTPSLTRSVSQETPLDINLRRTDGCHSKEFETTKNRWRFT